MTKKGYHHQEYHFRQFQRRVEKERLTKEQKRELQKQIRESSEIKEFTVTYKKRKYSTIVYRQKGRFISRKKYEEQIRKNKEIPETEKEGFYKRISTKTEYYRAVVAINGIPISQHYYSATLVKIDKLENINIDDMMDELLRRLEQSLHYRKDNWWFEWKPLKEIQYPKPYFGNERGEFYEFHKTK